MRTKLTPMFSFLLLAICACVWQTIPAHAQTAMTTTTSNQQMDDAQILGIINVIDDNEINEGKNAMGKNLSADVTNFANMMVQDHQANRDQVRALASKIGTAPNEESQAQDLRTKGTAELQSLQSQNGDQYAKTYMDNMVNGHTEALNTINQLLPEAQNEELKTFLTKTRDAVSSHLSKAKDIQSKLK